MNSDLSCHELSKPGWEGQGGDYQSYHSRKDQPAGGVVKQKALLVKQMQCHSEALKMLQIFKISTLHRETYYLVRKRVMALDRLMNRTTCLFR